jgi:hypothetical protein
MVRNYLGIVAIHALELRRQEAVALLLGAGMAIVDVDAQEQVGDSHNIQAIAGLKF